MLLFDCINHDQSRINFYLDGQIIRTAYLLADTVRVSGTSFMGIDSAKQFANPSAQVKKHMILSHASRNADPTFLTEVKKIYETLERGKKTVKHENKEMIVARKMMEKLLNQLYDSSKQEMLTMFATCGYIGLMPLVDEEAIVFLGSLSNHPESEEGGAVAYSEIMSSKWGEEDEVYCLTDLFWEYIREHNLTISPFDEADESASVLTFRLPDLPYINALSSTELKAVKQEVFGDMQPLRKAIEEWSLQLKGENFSAANFDRYSAYFTSSVLPYIQTAEERISRSVQLTKMNDLVRGKLGLNNYLAISAAKTVWDCMEWSGMVPKQSMHVFEENLPEGCDGDKAVLLFISHSFSHRTDEVAGDKKSLQL